MELKITILCENSVILPFGLIGEHGFAAYVEYGDRVFLFDTAQGKGLLNNSRLLKKDLKNIEFLYLSHGHYDHTLGIPDLLSIKSPLTIYAHPDIFKDRVWIINNKKKFIGMPFKKDYLEGLGAEFSLSKKFTQIDEGIYSSGEIVRKTSFEKIDAGMKIIDDNNNLVDDNILDDYSLAINTSKGLVIILGCAHSGIINIINHFVEKTGTNDIYAVLGGTHLGFASDLQIEETIKTIEKYNIKKLGASHCTGLEVAAKLYNKLKDRFFFASVGGTLEVN
ncbi:MAG: MBL fold metallo-hydrolase [Deferribacterota bacterium]|nr:MBL fold metallo-hydrolase [Deferribacterota bacterium]